MGNKRLTMFYMKKNPKYRWGYDQSKEDRVLANDVGVIYDFKFEESREDFFRRICKFPKRNMYGYDEKKDAKIIFGDWYDKVELAEQGYALDKLIFDKDWSVRKAVAKQRYGLDILINDPNYRVRRTVAEMGYKLNYILQNETNEEVLEMIIKSMKKYNEFYWIPNDKIALLTEEAAILYFTIISQNGLNSEEDIESFKEFVQNIIKKFGESPKTIKIACEICKKYKIKILVEDATLFDKRCGTYADFAKFSIMYDGKRGNEVKIGKFKIVHVENRSLVNDIEWWWEAYYNKEFIIQTADLTEAMSHCYNQHVLNCQKDENKSLFTEAAYLCDIGDKPAYFMMDALYKEATHLTLRKEMDSLKADGYVIFNMVLRDNELGDVPFKVASKSPTGMFSLLDWIKIGAQR